MEAQNICQARKWEDLVSLKTGLCISLTRRITIPCGIKHALLHTYSSRSPPLRHQQFPAQLKMLRDQTHKYVCTNLVRDAKFGLTHLLTSLVEELVQIPNVVCLVFQYLSARSDTQQPILKLGACSLDVRQAQLNTTTLTARAPSGPLQISICNSRDHTSMLKANMVISVDHNQQQHTCL